MRSSSTTSTLSLVALLLLSDSSSYLTRISSFRKPKLQILYANHELPTEVVPTDSASSSLTRSAFLTSLVTLPITASASSASNETFQESISGFVAGAALAGTKTLVKYPLDTATVRLQMPNSDYTVKNLVQLFDGSLRGVTVPLLVNIPAGAVFFAVKDACKAALKESEVPRFVKTSLAVAVAQFPYWLIRNPSEVVKTRQQAGLEGYGEGVSAWNAYQLVREEAIQNNKTVLDDFYLGYWENILYAYPADVMKFVCYELLTKSRQDLSPLEGAVAGAAATAIAQLATTPLDVVRNRVMAKKDTYSSKDAESPPSYAHSLIQLAKQEGLAGLFAGGIPRVGKALLSGAIQFATYEETKQEIAKLFRKTT